MKYPKTTILNINNLKVIHVHLPNTGVVFSSMNVKVGAFAENNNFPYGTAHFLEHMLFKGTKSFPSDVDIYEKIESLGCARNAHTHYNYSRYYFAVLKENMQNSLRIVSEILYSPVIPKELFDNEKKIIIEESKRAHTDAKKIAEQNKLMTTYKVKRSEEMILGSPESIEKIQYEDIINFYSKYYSLENSNLFVCGDILPEELEDILIDFDFKMVDKSHEVSEIPLPNISGELVIFNDSNRKNSYITISYPIPSISVPGYEECGIIAGLLSATKGPGYRRLRQELGLTYSISSQRTEGMLSFAFETDQKNEEAAIEAFKEVVKFLAINGISELDYKKIIMSRNFNELTKLSNIVEFGLAHSLNFMMRPNITSLEEYYNIINAPTKNSTENQIKILLKSEPTVVITR